MQNGEPKRSGWGVKYTFRIAYAAKKMHKKELTFDMETEMESTL